MVFALICATTFPKGKGTVTASLVLNPAKNGYPKETSPSRQVFSLPGSDNPRKYVQDRIKELVQRQELLVREVGRKNKKPMNFDLVHQTEGIIPSSKIVEVGHDRCRQIFSADTEPHSTLGMVNFLEPEKQKAILAVWGWARRLDILTDGINGSHAIPEDLDRWEQRLEGIFEGRPWDAYDAALADIVSKFPLDIMVFKDYIDGMRMDVWKQRIKTFDQACLYRYHISSSFYLIAAQIWGIAPESNYTLESIYTDAVTFGIGMSEADSLRDIAEDASFGRVYIPQDELTFAGITDDEIYNGVNTEKWQKLMKRTVDRARKMIIEGEKGIAQYNFDVRWWFLSGSMLYQQDLDAIEANDYDNLTKMCKPGVLKNIGAIALAYGKSIGFIR